MTREKKLEHLEDLISDFSGFHDDYYLTNEDNPYAEYCTWGFAEGQGLSFDNIDDADLKDACEELVKKVGKQDADRIIADHCSIELNSNLNVMTNELYSLLMGEIELEPSDDIASLIEHLKLTDKEVNKLSGDLYYARGMFYANYNYNSWCLVLDATSEDIKKLINERG